MQLDDVKVMVADAAQPIWPKQLAELMGEAAHDVHDVQNCTNFEITCLQVTASMCQKNIHVHT